jgi:hypothetical protein
MKRLLILLHGLPGAGKSTLARGVAELLPDLYYADVSSYPGFRVRPMSTLCSEFYDLYGRGQSLITEGVLPTASYRDTLVSKLMDHVRGSTPFDSAVILRVVVDLDVLSSRRKRSRSEYEKMAARVQPGSTKFDYHTFEAAVRSEQSQGQDIERLASIIETLRHT